MKTKLFFILSLFVFTSANLLSQDLPNGIGHPNDSIIGEQVGDIDLSNNWVTWGNKITTLSGSKLGSTNAYPLYFITNDIKRVTIDTLGNVGIGTENPQAKLAVDGTILAKGVKVNTNSTYWPDYVFSSDYELMSLKELENYIAENKHLPGIISAEEVEAQSDVDLGEMNAKLLEKIEEMTLYIIDLQKQIDELKNRKE